MLQLAKNPDLQKKLTLWLNFYKNDLLRRAGFFVAKIQVQNKYPPAFRWLNLSTVSDIQMRFIRADIHALGYLLSENCRLKQVQMFHLSFSFQKRTFFYLTFI